MHYSNRKNFYLDSVRYCHVYLHLSSQWSIKLSCRSFNNKNRHLILHVGAASFGFISREARFYLASARARHEKKYMIYIVVPRDREENEPCTTAALHNVQGALSTTDGKTDVVARPARDRGTRYTSVSGAWTPAADSALHVVRISSRTCPERASLARVIWRSLSARAPNSRGRPTRYVQICRDETLNESSPRRATSRDCFLPRLPCMFLFLKHAFITLES